MKDYLVKAIAYNNQVRAYAVRTTETLEKRNVAIRHGQLHRLRLGVP